MVGGRGCALLGRHVSELALHDPGLGLVRTVVRLRNAEVEQLRRAAVADHDVVRRDVAVDDVERLAMLVVRNVRIVERLGHVHRDANRDRQSDAPGLASLANQAPQGHAVDPFHHDEVRACVRAELMELADVRMLELHPDSRLVEEHLDEVAIALEMRKDPLDYQKAMVTVRVGVSGKENLRHSTEREPPKDVVAGEFPEYRKVDRWLGLLASCGLLRQIVPQHPRARPVRPHERRGNRLSPRRKVSHRTA